MEPKNLPRKAAEPQLQETPPPIAEPKPVINKKKAGYSVGKSVHDVLDGSILTRKSLVRQIPFLFFITLLALIYIANHYNAEKTIIDISRTKRLNEELRYSYITTKSQLMFHTKQSEVVRKLEKSGIHELTSPPSKLVIKEEANGR